jgi:hypothetical protein
MRPIYAACAVAFTLTAAADLGAFPAAVAVVFLTAACLWLPAALLLRPARAADRQLRSEIGAWREALVNDRSAQLSHDLAHWPRRALGQSTTLLRRSGRPTDAARVERAAERCAQAAGAVLGAPSTRDFGDLTGGQVGVVGGAILASPSRSGGPLRRLSRAEGLPDWLGPRWAERLALVLRPIDLVRLLHTPQIERRALIASLWLRAAFVLVAPLTGPLSLTGAVPLQPGAGTLATTIYWVVATEAVAMALLAPRVVAYVTRQPVRRPLLLVEQGLAVALLATSPCWACFIYAAGPVIWFEKVEWEVWKVFAWGALNVGVLAAFAGAAPAAIVGEAAIGLLVVATVADSYGLMLPAVVTTLLHGRHQRRTAKRSIAGRTRNSRSTIREAIDETKAMLVAIAAEDGEIDRSELTQLVGDLTRAEEHLDAGERSGTGRRSPALADVCARAIANAGVPPVGWDPVADLHSTQIETVPADLGRLELSSRRTARGVELLLTRIAFEAVSHGLGLLSTRIEREGDRVSVTLANEIHPEPLPGTRTGGRWIEALAQSLPDARVDEGRPGEFNGLSMWIVRVSLGSPCFTEHK